MNGAQAVNAREASLVSTAQTENSTSPTVRFLYAVTFYMTEDAMRLTFSHLMVPPQMAIEENKCTSEVLQLHQMTTAQVSFDLPNSNINTMTLQQIYLVHTV